MECGGGGSGGAANAADVQVPRESFTTLESFSRTFVLTGHFFLKVGNNWMHIFNCVPSTVQMQMFKQQLSHIGCVCWNKDALPTAL